MYIVLPLGIIELKLQMSWLKKKEPAALNRLLVLLWDKAVNLH